MVDYAEGQEAGTDANAEVFSGLIDIHRKGAHILERKDPFVYPSSDIILVKQGTIVALFNNLWRTFEVHQDIELGAGDLDTGGGFQVGTDYYVYLVDDGAGGVLVISANSTYPSGAAAENSRKLGGFHFGHIRCVNSRYAPVDGNGVVFGATGTIWQNNVVIGIVPNSVWDLKNRPTCSPEGMVLVGNRWVDIYLSSAAEVVTFENSTNGLFVAAGLLQSKYGMLPATGVDGLNWFSFQELAIRSGKRNQTYAEFVQDAVGNPGGQDNANDYGWTSLSNSQGRTRTGCQVNPSTGQYDSVAGVKPYAISAYTLVDMVGNVNDWTDDFVTYDGNTTTSGTWRQLFGLDKGYDHTVNENSLRTFMCGGLWAWGAYGGSRAITTSQYPFGADASYAGAHLVCDRLVA
jgi:hypothetical protein